MIDAKQSVFHGAIDYNAKGEDDPDPSWKWASEEDSCVTRDQITVLGGGNTAFSMAANLALAGCEVLLWEHPNFAHTLDPIRESLIIHLDGAARTGTAKLVGVTTDAAEA